MPLLSHSFGSGIAISNIDNKPLYRGIYTFNHDVNTGTSYIVPFKPKASTSIMTDSTALTSVCIKGFMQTGQSRNLMFYGEPGNGKSQLIEDIYNKNTFINEYGVPESKMFIIIANSFMQEFSRFLAKFRDMYPDEKLLIVFPDVDDYIFKYGDKIITEIIQGEMAIDKTMSIATTNYINKLSKRMKDRFLLVEQKTSDEDRKAYLAGILEGDALDEFTALTENWSFRSLSVIKLYIRTWGMTLDRLRKMINLEIDSKAKLE